MPAGTANGDRLLLRGSFAEGYELVECASGVLVASGLNTLHELLTVVRRYGARSGSNRRTASAVPSARRSA